MNSITENNSIGKLQERFQSRNVMPEYTEVAATGPAPFQMQVKVFDFVAVGSGMTKKEAKREAAAQMLLKLDGKVKKEVTSCASLPTASGDACVENPIGRLQEFCMAQKLPMPRYTDEERTGSAHMPTFTVSCSIATMYKTLGSGTSKQSAKTESAVKMLNLVCGKGGGSNESTRTSKPSVHREHSPLDMDASFLSQESFNSGSSSSMHSIGHGQSPRSVRSGSTSSLQSLGYGQSPGSPSSRSTSSLRSNDFGNQSYNDSQVLPRPVCVAAGSVRTLRPSEAKEIANFFNVLNTSASRLEDLLKISLASNRNKAKQILGDISKEQNFNVVYIDLEPTERGEFQSLVQISTMPVLVGRGAGIDKESSDNDAALTALYYLKTMVSKTED